MPATPSHRQLTVADRPGVLAKTFWELAGQAPDSRDPIAVARAAAKALESLERTDHGPHVTAATLTFLLRLDGDRIYAAPEQTRGDKTSQRSLVFTVGVLVFQKLTGQHPFGATVRRPEDAAAADECIPPELRAALDIAMAPFPADRWNSLRALRGELERIVERDRSMVVEMRRSRRRSVPPPCPGSAVRRFARGSRPAPIPNAPERADTSDDEELDLDAGPSRAVVAPRVAKAAVVDVAVKTAPAAEPKAKAAEAPLVDLELLESKPWHALARACVLMSIGAGLALTAVWLVGQPMDAVGAPSALKQVPVRTATVELPAIVVELSDEAAEPAAVAAEPAAVAAVADDATAAQTDGAAMPADELDVEPEPAGGVVSPPSLVEPAVFDPGLAGGAALVAMRECFTDERLQRGVEVSASLRFTRDDGLSDRVYFAPAQPLDNDERSCVRERLVGLSAGAAPARNAVVPYTFWLSPQRTRFWSKTPR